MRTYRFHAAQWRTAGRASVGSRERLRQAQEPQRTLDPPAEVPCRGGDALGARQAQQADGHVAHRRHRVRARPLAYLGAILVVGHIPHVVQAVLDLPVVAVVGEQLCR